MKKTICAILAMTPLVLGAQISVTSTDFGNAGDTIRISTTTTTQVDLSQAGANQSWDFSGLVAESQKLIEYNSMDQASFLINLSFGSFASPQYKASYYAETDALPLDMVNTVLPVTLDEINLFSKLEDTKLTACGYSVSFNGTEVPVKSDTVETYYELPLEFGNVYTSVGYTRLDLNPIQDIQWSQYRQRTSNVDGWGSITTPLGTFDCIRVKHIIQETDSIYLAQIQNWIPIPIPEQVIYEWWTNGQKLPLVKVNTTSIVGQETVTGIEFRDNYNPQLASIEENEQAKISLYPNPAQDFITVDGLDLEERFQIFDSKGAVQFEGLVSNVNSEISIQELKSGVYILRLENGAKFSFIKK